jgi:hypothetical protein
MIPGQSTCAIYSADTFGVSGERRAPSRTSRTVRREHPRARAISRRLRPLGQSPSGMRPGNSPPFAPIRRGALVSVSAAVVASDEVGVPRMRYHIFCTF